MRRQRFKIPNSKLCLKNMVVWCKRFGPFSISKLTVSARTCQHLFFVCVKLTRSNYKISHEDKKKNEFVRNALHCVLCVCECINKKYNMFSKRSENFYSIPTIKLLYYVEHNKICLFVFFSFIRVYFEKCSTRRHIDSVFGLCFCLFYSNINISFLLFFFFSFL